MLSGSWSDRPWSPLSKWSANADGSASFTASPNPLTLTFATSMHPFGSSAHGRYRGELQSQLTFPLAAEAEAVGQLRSW